MADHSQSSNSTFILLGMLFILAGFAFLYIFQVPALRDIRDEVATKEATEKAKQHQIGQLEAAQSELARKEQELQSQGVNPQKLASIIPVTEEIPSLYLQMEAQRNHASGLSAISYQIGTPALDSENGAAKIPVIVSATGSYTDLKTFLANLETNIRPVSFSSVTLSHSADTEGAAMTLSATGFFRSQGLSSGYAHSL